MGISGGGSNWDLRPVQHMDGILGSHKGTMEALNIRGAKPGTHYYYERNHPGRILRRLNMGYRVLTDNDQEGWGVTNLPEEFKNSAVDTARAYGDVVAMATPMENYRKIRKEKDRLAELAREGGAGDYLGKSSQIEGRLGGSVGSNPLYYKRPNHS